jgi:predicted nucleotidyltransferase
VTTWRPGDHPRGGADNAEHFIGRQRTEPETRLQVPAARLTRDELEFGLKAIIQRLQERGEPAELRIVGGAAISLWHNAARGATQDIDAALSPADVVLDVAKAVAVEQGWPDDWVNDKAHIFLPSGMGSRGEEWETVYASGTVTVKVASLDMLIAMKLYAAQRRARREYEDLRVLLAERGVRTQAEAEALFEDFYPGDDLNDTAYRILGIALENPERPEVRAPEFE